MCILTCTFLDYSEYISTRIKSLPVLSKRLYQALPPSKLSSSLKSFWDSTLYLLTRNCQQRLRRRSGKRSQTVSQRELTDNLTGHRKEKPYNKSKELTSNLTGQRERSHTVSQREVYCFVSQRELTGNLTGHRKEKPYSKSKEPTVNLAGQREEKPYSKSKELTST